jgi:hypothetical protein
MRGSEGFQDMAASAPSAAMMAPDAQGQMLPDAAPSVSGFKVEKFENGSDNATLAKLAENAASLAEAMKNLGPSGKKAEGFQSNMKKNIAGKAFAAIKKKSVSGFQDVGAPMPAMDAAVPPMMPAAPSASMEGFANLNPQESPFPEGTQPANCYPKNQLAPQELLPTDPNSKWAEVNPTGAGDIGGKNFLGAGALIGVNTVGQSLRNANLQLRSEPANPQRQVSIWNQSTIEPDLQRRPLEGF